MTSCAFYISYHLLVLKIDGSSFTNDLHSSIWLPTYLGIIIPVVLVKGMNISVARYFSRVTFPPICNIFFSSFFLKSPAFRFYIIVVPVTNSSYFEVFGPTIGGKPLALDTIVFDKVAIKHCMCTSLPIASSVKYEELVCLYSPRDGISSG